MSNYTQTTFFTPKDSLASGNPAKIIYGALFDPEFANIATAIATKYDNTTTSISLSSLSTVTMYVSQQATMGGNNLAVPPLILSSNFGATNPTLVVNGSAAGGGVVQQISNVTATSAFIEFAGNGNTLGGANTAYVGQDSAGLLALNNRGAAGAYISTSGNQRLAISSSGAVTINAPSTNTTGLSVAANSDAGSAFLSQYLDGTNNPRLIVSHSSASLYTRLDANGTTSSACVMQLATNNTPRLAITAAGNVSINIPSSGNSLAVAVSGGSGVAFTAASGQNANLFIAGNGATTGTQGMTISHTSAGAFIQTNTTDSLFLVTNGTTRITVGSTGSVGLYSGASLWAQLAGFGTPTGAVVVANYPGATATLLQTSNTVAQILLALKALGIFAA
jgi:hypothetical protein